MGVEKTNNLSNATGRVIKSWEILTGCGEVRSSAAYAASCAPGCEKTEYPQVLVAPGNAPRRTQKITVIHGQHPSWLTPFPQALIVSSRLLHQKSPECRGDGRGRSRHAG